MKQLSYFKNGFSVVIKNVDLLLISIVFPVISFFTKTTEKGMYGRTLLIFGFISAFLSFGYYLSIPTFLQNRQWKGRSDYRNMVRMIFHNAKRTIKPILVATLFFILISFVVVILLGLVGKGHGPFLPVLDGNSTTTKYVLAFIFTIVFSFFIFAQFFFSLYFVGAFESLKKSFFFSLHHLQFLSIVICIELISLTVHTLLPDPGVFTTVYSLILSPILSFFITCSSYLYFKTFVRD